MSPAESKPTTVVYLWLKFPRTPPAYNDPSFGTRQLEAFLENPDFGQYMAHADKVAGIIADAAELERRGKLELRLPVGPDSWRFIRRKYESGLQGLGRVRDMAFATGNEEILSQTGFLYD